MDLLLCSFEELCVSLAEDLFHAVQFPPYLLVFGLDQNEVVHRAALVAVVVRNMRKCIGVSHLDEGLHTCESSSKCVDVWLS